jgi:hypothetical protein
MRLYGLQMEERSMFFYFNPNWPETQDNKYQYNTVKLPVNRNCIENYTFIEIELITFDV